MQNWRRCQRSAKTSDIEHAAASCEIFFVTKKHRATFPFQWRADRHEIFHAAKPRGLSLRVAHIRQARREPTIAAPAIVDEKVQRLELLVNIRLKTYGFSQYWYGTA